MQNDLVAGGMSGTGLQWRIANAAAGASEGALSTDAGRCRQRSDGLRVADRRNGQHEQHCQQMYTNETAIMRRARVGNRQHVFPF